MAAIVGSHMAGGWRYGRDSNIIDDRGDAMAVIVVS